MGRGRLIIASLVVPLCAVSAQEVFYWYPDPTCMSANVGTAVTVEGGNPLEFTFTSADKDTCEHWVDQELVAKGLFVDDTYWVHEPEAHKPDISSCMAGWYVTLFGFDGATGTYSREFHGVAIDMVQEPKTVFDGWWFDDEADKGGDGGSRDDPELGPLVKTVHLTPNRGWVYGTVKDPWGHGVWSHVQLHKGGDPVGEQVETDQNGNYKIEYVLPGDYIAYADAMMGGQTEVTVTKGQGAQADIVVQGGWGADSPRKLLYHTSPMAGGASVRPAIGRGVARWCCHMKRGFAEVGLGFFLVACVAVGASWGQGVGDRDSMLLLPIPSQTWPEDALPPRVLINTPVTVETTGTVVDVVARIAASSERDWLVSIAPDTALAERHYAVNQEAAWLALDALREGYGYDWGCVEATIVCWPAMLPSRGRERPAAEPALERVRDERGGALHFPEPVELSEALDRARAGGALGGMVVYPHPELVTWRVAGSLSAPDRVQFVAALGGALGATTDSAAVFHRLVVGSHRRLDAAIRMLDADRELATLDGERAKLRLIRSLLPMLCVQQWTLMRTNNGVAEVAFRELPVETAAMVVTMAHERARVENLDFDPDWTRPDRIKVTIRSNTGYRETQDGWVLVPNLAVSVHVPGKNGVLFVL